MKLSCVNKQLGAAEDKGLGAFPAVGLWVVLIGFNRGVGVIIICLCCCLGDFHNQLVSVFSSCSFVS